MDADDVLEDLRNGEQEGCCHEIYWQSILVYGSSVLLTRVLTHRLAFAENAQNQECLEEKEDDDEEQRHKLVQRVQSVGLVGWVETRVPEAGPVKAGIQCDIAGADEYDGSRAQEQTN